MSPPREINVLVVEDDEDIRDVLVEVLEDEHYTVRAARNGAEALDALRSARPALILLDLTMPVMNGEEFRTRQLADPALASIPTVVMTAADRIQERTASMGVVGALPKPIKLEDLLAAVARYAKRGG